jgi:hypothetical protein
VPGNDNEVYDLTWDGKRIWFAELNGGIGWFDPSQVSCDSLLDYSKHDAANPLLVKDAHTNCPTNGPGCFHTIPRCTDTVTTGCAPAQPAFIKLVADPDPTGGDNNRIWFTGINGALGKISYDANGNLTGVQQWCNAYPSSPFVNGCPSTASPFPTGVTDRAVPFVWNAIVDQNNVYMVESNDMTLVKFNKSSQTFSRIPLPITSGDVSTHYLLSLGISGGKLYFVTQDGWNDALLGYVDIATWNAGTPTGKAYTGLADLNAANQAQAGRSGFDGLSFNQTNGAIAIADFYRQQIYILRH